MNPLITIVTPSYNQGEFIQDTILSVLNQDYQNIQYIIIDGGSTDDTMDIIMKYKDRIDIVVHEKDKGQSDAINKGFKLAKGDWVTWLNSDDILLPHAISEFVDFLYHRPDGSIYYASNLNWIDSDSKFIKTVTVKIRDRDDLLNNNYSLIQQGSFYKLADVQSIGYINEDLNFCMDLDLWLRLLSIGKIYYVNSTWAAFRIWGLTKTSQGGNEFLCEIENVLKSYNMKLNSSNYLRLKIQMAKNILKRFLLWRI